MREVALTIPAEAVEHVLDRILPIVPFGVHQVQVGDDVELRVRGADLPRDLAKRAGRAVLAVREREVPDDWKLVRRLDMQPLQVGRFAVRHDWMEPVEAHINVVLSDPDAFGVGTHPTTRLCLLLMSDLEPSGAFADLGCGTGVLAAAAAAHGWDPVLAVDANPRAIATTAATAAATGVKVQAAHGDLRSVPLPALAGAVANLPGELHANLAARMSTPPAQFIITGVLAHDMDAVLEAYGLPVAERIDDGGWSAALLQP